MVSTNIIDTQDEVTRLRPSITARVTRSYVDMRTTTEELLSERPSEARLLMFVLISNMIFTLSWALKTLISPTAATTASMGVDVVIWLIVALMLRTTAIYALALVIGVVANLMGGKATIADTRAGVIWGIFVSAPIGLLIAMIGVFINEIESSVPLLQNSGIQMTPYWLGIIPFIWFVSKGVAAANRVENVAPIFGAIATIFVVIGFAIKLMLRGGRKISDQWLRWIDL